MADEDYADVIETPRSRSDPHEKIFRKENIDVIVFAREAISSKSMYHTTLKCPSIAFF